MLLYIPHAENRDSRMQYKSQGSLFVFQRINQAIYICLSSADWDDITYMYAAELGKRLNLMNIFQYIEGFPSQGMIIHTHGLKHNSLGCEEPYITWA